jgi:hypothetical protein
MPRYFFRLTNDDTFQDDRGQEFDRIETARDHAVAVAHELSRGRPPATLVGQHIDVVDERGAVVLSVPLSAPV